MTNKSNESRKTLTITEICGDTTFEIPNNQPIFKNLIISLKNNSTIPLFFVTLSIRMKVKDTKSLAPEWRTSHCPYGYWGVDHGTPPTPRWWIFYYHPKIKLDPQEPYKTTIPIAIKEVAKPGKYYIYLTLGAYKEKENPETWFHTGWKRLKIDLIKKE